MNPEDSESGRVVLSSADGEEFRILSVTPAVVGGLPTEAGLEHVLTIDWDLWERAGRGVRATFAIDHPRMAAISVMIRPQSRQGERPDLRPELAPINPNTARLIAAAKTGDIALIDETVRSGAILDEADRISGRTALHWAAREGHAEAVEALLLAGAKLEVEDRTGKTALSAASEEGRLDVVELLLKEGAKIDHRDRIGGSPLLWAAGIGNVETVAALISGGADVNVADTNGLTPLLWAAGIGDPKSVSLLLKAKADAAVRDRISGDDALIRAARSGKDETVRILVGHGARTDTRNNTGMTALLMAASVGSVDRVKMLVEANSDLTAVCDRGWTALEHARNRVDANRDAVVEYLEGLKK